MAYQMKPNFSLSYVDFVPQCLKKSGLFSKPEYERFSVLVDGANQWLRRNPGVCVRTAESIEIKWKSSSQTAIDTVKSSYVEYANRTMLYIRALRLWLVPQAGGSAQAGPVQIGYYNVVPVCTDPGGVFSNPKFENFSQTLDQLNNHIRQHPLPGRILNLETQDMKFHKSTNKPDPDETCWLEHGNVPKLYVNIIRIFFEVGSPAHQEIGCADFTPSLIQEACWDTNSKFEPFAAVVAKANDWIRLNPGCSILNIQSIDYKVKAVCLHIDTHRTTYVEQAKAITKYMRMVRVTYTRGHAGGNSSGILTYKTFLPAALRQNVTFGWPIFEGMPQTMNRIQHWLNATGVNVLAAETVPIRMSRGNQRLNPEKTFTYNHGNENYLFAYAVRLYLDRQFQEPLREELPAVPTPQDGGCCVIL